MKYDDASWHYNGNFPSDLPLEAGATHIALFLAWAALNGLAGEYHTVDAAEDLARLSKREITPREWFVRVSDEKFTDEDLNAEGNRFAALYYAGEGLPSPEGTYLLDYAETFPAASSLYHVADSWTSFDALAPTLERRLRVWRGA